MKQGIFTMSEEMYHSDKIGSEITLSNSIAKIIIQQSPQHAWYAHPRLNPRYQSVDSDRFDLGTACHSLLLEQSDAKIVYIDHDDYRTNAAKETRDMARAKGLTPILRKYEKSMLEMVSKAHEKIKNSELAGIFQNGKPEQTLVWQDGDAWCRARLDWLRADNKVILDYKTTDSADPETCIRKIASMGYDMQASFYKRGLVACGGSEDAVFVFLFQEITAPYACCLVGLSEMFIEIANEKVEQAISIWDMCMKTGKWPSYPDQITLAEPPAWALTQYLNMMEERALGEENE
jgi:hypothetical protein